MKKAKALTDLESYQGTVESLKTAAACQSGVDRTAIKVIEVNRDGGCRRQNRVTSLRYCGVRMTDHSPVDGASGIDEEIPRGTIKPAFCHGK